MKTGKASNGNIFSALGGVRSQAPEDLREKWEQINREIEMEEREKAKLQEELSKLTDQLRQVSERLECNTKKRDEYAKDLEEASPARKSSEAEPSTPEGHHSEPASSEKQLQKKVESLSQTPIKSGDDSANTGDAASPDAIVKTPCKSKSKKRPAAGNADDATKADDAGEDAGDTSTPAPKASKKGRGKGARSNASKQSAKEKDTAKDEEDGDAQMEVDTSVNQDADMVDIKVEGARKGKGRGRGRGGDNRGAKRKTPPVEADDAIKKLEALPAASESELTGFNSVAEAFRSHVQANGCKESDDHVMQMWAMFQEDEKSLSTMASEEYSNLVVASTENPDDGKARSETLSLFADFWNGMDVGAQRTLLSSGTGARSQTKETKKETRIRTELQIPSDWQLTCTPTRDRGDILEVRSHDGRAWTSMEEAKAAAAADFEVRSKMVGECIEIELKKADANMQRKLNLLNGFIRKKSEAMEVLHQSIVKACSRKLTEEEVRAVVSSELGRRRSEVSISIAETRKGYAPMLMSILQKKSSGAIVHSGKDKKVLGLYAELPTRIGGRPVYSRWDTWLGEQLDGQDHETVEGAENVSGFGHESSASSFLAWSSSKKGWVVSATENPDSTPENKWVAMCTGSSDLADGQGLAEDVVATDTSGSAWKLCGAPKEVIAVSAASPDNLLRVAMEYLRSQQQVCCKCGTSPDDTESIDKLLRNCCGSGDYEKEERAHLNRLAWESIDDVRPATEEEREMFPRMLVTFDRWLTNDVDTIGACSKKGYVFSMRCLFEDDAKSPEEMASQEFFQLVKQDERNRTGNGQRQAAIQYWIPFWQEFKDKQFDELPKDPKARDKFKIEFGKKRIDSVVQDVQQEIEVPLEQMFPELCGQDGEACITQLKSLIGEDGFLVREVDASGQIPVKRDLRDGLAFATPEEWADVPKILKTFEAYARKQQQTSEMKTAKIAKVEELVESMRDLFNAEALSPDTVAGERYQSVVREENKTGVGGFHVKLFRDFWVNWQAEHSGETFLDPSRGTFMIGVVPPLYKVLDLKDATARATRRREMHGKYKIPLDWRVEVSANLSVKIKHPDGRAFTTPEKAVAAFAAEREAAKEAAAKQAEKAVTEALTDAATDGPAEKKRCRSSGFKTMQRGSEGITDRLMDSMRDLVLRRHEWQCLGVRPSSAWTSGPESSPPLVPLSEAGGLQATSACAVFLFDARAAKHQLEAQLRKEWNLPDDWNFEIHPRLGGNLTIATDTKGRKYFSRASVEVQAKLYQERQRRIRSTESLIEAIRLLKECGEKPIFELKGISTASPVHRAQGLFTDQSVEGRREYRKASAFNLIDEEPSITIRLVLPKESGCPEPRWVVGGSPDAPEMGLAWGVATPESMKSGGIPAVVGQWQIWKTCEGGEGYIPEEAFVFEQVPSSQTEGTVCGILQQPVACCDFCTRPVQSRALTAASDARLGYANRLRDADPELLQAKDLQGMVKHMLSKLLVDGNAAGLKLKALANGKSRKIRVGTMCSGTDSPILAMRAIAAAMTAAQCGSIEVEHLFSCEFDKEKQRFLKANFPDMGLLFDDVTKLGNKQALDAISGKMKKVPGQADVIIAGFSCKDLSGMNRNRKALDEMGQSGQTLQGCLDYIAVHRPRMVIFENVRNICTRSQETELRPVDLVMVALRRLGYSSGWKFLDTSKFYLPQSRARVWMWGYRDETIDPKTIPTKAPSVEKLSEELVDCADKAAAVAEGPRNAAINEAVDGTLEALQEPAAIHFDDLLLPDDDANVVRYMESRMGRDKNKSLIQASAKLTWDVKIQQHRDALRNRFSKPYTSYRGAPWLTVLNQRERELCDLNFNEVYEERGIDARQHPMLWEMSQSAGRVPGTRTREHRMHCSPCILPGNLWHTTRRRWLLGREKLRLQGIFEQDMVDMSVATEKTLGDLAGNAFSATVAAANILAALIHGGLDK
jgi:site-specific DNA-cytosine methylase